MYPLPPILSPGLRSPSPSDALGLRTPDFLLSGYDPLALTLIRMSDAVITVSNVSKAYRIWQAPAARLTAPAMESLARFLPPGPAATLRAKATRRYRDFWALKDISFDVRRGEAVGIVGRNGSGKSTLLQIIAGTMRPTTGAVQVNGRVAALLELGSGFNPEFTGRENVFLNATVLGLSREQTQARFGDIADFADIGDFIDQPVKTYSSGMMVRLAFAVSVAIRPDILIVDEALAVGDAAFQRKCYRRIEEMRERGCTFLFVSHDLNAVTNLCQAAVLLERGTTLASGEARAVADRYQQLIFGEATQNQLKEYGDGSAHFLRLWLEDDAGQPIAEVHAGQPFKFCYEIEFRNEIEKPLFGLRVTNVQGILLVSTNTHMLNHVTSSYRAGDRVRVAWHVRLPLSPGYVFFSAGCSYHDRDQFLCRKLDVLKVPVLGPFNHSGLLAVIEPDGVDVDAASASHG